MNAEQISILLYLHVRIPPEAWDAIFPQGPKVSVAAREYMIAMALKGFSAKLSNRKVLRQLREIQTALVSFAGGQLAADYDDDDWCGTRWPGKFPVPHPWPWLLVSNELNPQPEPPAPVMSKQIGGYLLLLSQATSQKEAAKQLETIGKTLVGG